MSIDPAADFFELDLVADLDRLGDGELNPGDHVADRVLGGEADDRRQHGGRGEDPGGELLEFGELGDRDRGDDQEDDQEREAAQEAQPRLGRAGDLGNCRRHGGKTTYRGASRSAIPGEPDFPYTNWGPWLARARGAAGDGHGDRDLGADRDRRQPRRAASEAGENADDLSATALALAQMAQELSFLLVPSRSPRARARRWPRRCAASACVAFRRLAR